MSVVETVLGADTADSQGFTAICEHLLYRLPGWEHSPEALEIDYSQVFNQLLTKLRAFAAVGGRQIVDLGGPWLGRDVRLYGELSRASGVRIVASTGFLDEDHIYPWWQSKAGRILEDFARFTTNELSIGMVEPSQHRAQARAGIIALGVTEGKLSTHDETVCRAVGFAAKLTGSAIYLTTPGGAPAVLPILEDLQVRPAAIVVGWNDHPLSDPDHALELARRGYSVAYDHVSWNDVITDAQRATSLKRLVDAGLTDQVLVSCSGVGVNGDGGWTGPDWTAAYTSFTSRLAQVGISSEAIQTIFSRNPLRVLARA